MSKLKIDATNFKVGRFFFEVRDELKKVIWPTKNETIRLTTIVIVSSVAAGSFLGFIDFIFTKIFSSFLGI